MNRLAQEKSPYLLQHAANPVDWYPWGPEALSRAREEDKPILVSIGYSACHWCHVMEHDAFEDPSIASTMNQIFVNIKVDREERPDVDAIYMEAVQALTGQGGWPLNVFLTPDGRPFFGGTYFPPQPAHGLPSWSQVLASVAGTFRERRDDVLHNASILTDYIRHSQLLQESSHELSSDLLDRAYSSIESQFDWQNGGFGGAPKFPQPLALEFVLRTWGRRNIQDAQRFVRLTLDRMAAGGIFDQIGGGFHRYSVDATWTVPHFEKMLYDNALLARVYLHAFQVTGEDLYREICERTLSYMAGELGAPQGGFFSAQDADSEGVEGRFYVWTPEQMRHVLTKEEARVAALGFGVSDHGNFEGATILTRALTATEIADKIGMSEMIVDELLNESRVKILAARSRRIAPGTDTKILTSWNALAISSFAEAGRILGREDYVTLARKTADFLLRDLRPKGRLVRSYRDGPSAIPAFLEDFAYLIDALLHVYESSSETRYLVAAEELATEAIDRFWDPRQQLFFDAPADSSDTVVRPRSLFDNPIPSGTAATALALARLGALTGDTKFEPHVRSTFESVSGLVERASLSFPALLSALDFYLSPQIQIAITGERDDEDTRSLLDVTRSIYLPNAVLSVGPEDSAPLLRGRARLDDAATAYVCRLMSCRLPTRDPKTLASQLLSRVPG